MSKGYLEFNPKKSYYHQIIIKKYLKRGRSYEQAYKLAKREWQEGLLRELN